MKTTNTDPLARPHPDDVDNVWSNDRPQLTVTNKGGRNLGRCYNASFYEVTSNRPLSMEDLYRIRECGFLGYGQEFICSQVIGDTEARVPERFNPGKYVVGYRGDEDEKFPKSDTVKPSGMDKVPARMFHRRTGELIPGEARNRYTGEALEPMEMPYYVYRCESRVDSSD